MKMPGFPPWPNSAHAYEPMSERLHMPLYNPTQVEAMMRAYGEMVREECAKLAESLGMEYQTQEGSYSAGKKAGAFACAEAIRSKD